MYLYVVIRCWFSGGGPRDGKGDGGGVRWPQQGAQGSEKSRKEGRILALPKSTFVLHICQWLFQGHDPRIQRELQLLSAWLQCRGEARDYPGELPGRRQGQQHVQRWQCQFLLSHVTI